MHDTTATAIGRAFGLALAVAHDSRASRPLDTAEGLRALAAKLITLAAAMTNEDTRGALEGVAIGLDDYAGSTFGNPAFDD